MQALAPPRSDCPSRLLPGGPVQVSVTSLRARDQLVVRDLRAVRAGSEAGPLARVPSPGAPSAEDVAIARYVRELRQDESRTIAAAAMDEAEYLTISEACTLQAIDCMRAGLLGDAWKILAEICAPGRAGDALIALEEVAATRGRAGPSVPA